MVMLQDINGDGLPDHLMKQDGQNIKVKYNYGGSFGPETEWQTPGWGHQIGRDELKVLFGGNDALGYSGTYMLSVGFGVELTIFCIPCPLTPCVCITLDPASTPQSATERASSSSRTSTATATRTTS